MDCDTGSRVRVVPYGGCHVASNNGDWCKSPAGANAMPASGVILHHCSGEDSTIGRHRHDATQIILRRGRALAHHDGERGFLLEGEASRPGPLSS